MMLFECMVSLEMFVEGVGLVTEHVNFVLRWNFWCLMDNDGVVSLL